MSQKLINHSPDLKKLRDEGVNIEVSDGLLLVHGVPYVDSERRIRYGSLVSTLDLAGDKTVKPQTHVISFIGDHPCNKDGSIIKQIQHQSEKKTLRDGIVIDHSFSNKPRSDGYIDYYEKIRGYIAIISAPAKSLDHSITEINFPVVVAHEGESVFNYFDTNASRAEILNVTSKLEGQKIAIIGLGGTGSYILDFVAKTPVQEIHLFDGDVFLQHNAFRAPGAPSIEKLGEKKKKVAYFQEIYSQMRQNIFPHEDFISEENINDLSTMDFVFICIDTGPIKANIVKKLIECEISFVDVGMGINEVDGSLIGIIRTTTSTKDARNHIKKRISFAEDGEDEYSTNIQIAELNAFNAALAVIKWKKLSGFYQDFGKEHHSTYTINTGQLSNNDAA
jgi:hypothetical protein